jgi:hypothetical protein
VVPVLPSRWHRLIYLYEEPDCVVRSFVSTTIFNLLGELQDSIVSVSVRDKPTMKREKKDDRV